jgi:anti-anti-sigma factor
MELTVLPEQNQARRVKIAGRIVQHSMPPNCETVIDPPADGHAKSVVVDLGDSVYIDSSGLSWLLVRHKRLRAAGKKLILHNVPPMVMDVLKVMRLDQVFDLADDERSALNLANG